MRLDHPQDFSSFSSNNNNNVLRPLDVNLNHGGTATPFTSLSTPTNRRRRDPLRDVPVEMVDVTTCQVVHTFATAQEAHTVMSGTGIAQFGNFKKVLMGHHRFPHSIYKGYLFRPVGSDKVPPQGYRPTTPRPTTRRIITPTLAVWKNPPAFPTTNTTTVTHGDYETAAPHPESENYIGKGDAGTVMDV
jgi:hypothetical protein